MAMTVTATEGGATNNGILLRVYVLTGAAAAASQAGGSVSTNFASNTNAWTLSITTSAGSAVYGSASMSLSGNTPTGTTLTVVDQFADSINAQTYVTGKVLNVTSGAATRGFQASPAAAGPLALQEIIASGTLAEDASAPAVATATGASTVTTASFTPVNNALIVAVVSCDGGAGATTMTVSGGGLTWTQKANNGASGAYAGIWIADGPAGPAAAPPAPLASLPGRTWLRHFRHQQLLTPPGPQAGGPVTANAALATGTGTASDATVEIDVTGNTTATATGTALQPSIALAAPTAQPVIQATLVAFPVPQQTPPQVITGTAGPVTANAGLAAAAGAALTPAVTITPNAGLATGTGTALSPAVAGSGIASAGLPTGTGAALSPAVAITVPAGLATGTGAALTAAPQVTALAGPATGTGAALQPSVSTSGNTTANAQLATGTAAAQPPVPTVIALAGLATGTGAAQAGQRIIPAGLATGTGTAQAPALTVIAQAQAAAALAAALNGTVPAQHVPAKSTSAVTDPRDGTAAVTAIATSTPSVT